MTELHSNQTVSQELADWITHLQDNDSTGAWNKKDSKFFDEIVKSLITERRNRNEAR